MNDCLLTKALSGLHANIQRELELTRTTIVNPSDKGNASEDVWNSFFNNYLPSRYKADKAYVVDSKGSHSEQIDVVIYDRQYSPFILDYRGTKVIPAESVYAVFEVKQSANRKHIKYAQNKVRSVRKLHRTSLPIPHAGGEYPAKDLMPICGGLLSSKSIWSPKIGCSFIKALNEEQQNGKLDCGCVAEYGFFYLMKGCKEYVVSSNGKPITEFLFWLIHKLQSSGTVPMINVQAYARWLHRNI